MFSSSRVTILHCGVDRATLGVFSRRGARVECSDLAEVAVRYEDDAEGSRWRKNMGTAMQALRHGRAHPGPVVLVLPPHLTLLKHLQTPRVDDRRRSQIVSFAAAQNIPHPLGEVAWDSVLSGEGDASQHVLLAAAKLEQIEPLCMAAQVAGFALCRVVPSALAVLAACQVARAGRTETELVIQVRPRAATLLLVGARGFALRTARLGANEHEAEDALVARLGPEVTRSLLHFQRQNEIGHPVRVSLFGEAGRQSALSRGLAEQLKLPVQDLDGRGVIDFAPAVNWDERVRPEPWPELTGAALLHLLSRQAGLNLLPPRWQTRLRRRRRLPWLAAAAGLALAAPVGPWLHFRTLAKVTQSKQAAIEANLVAVRAREATNRAGLAQLAEVKRALAAWQAVEDRQGSWVQLFADLQERLTRVEDVWLDGMQVVPVADGKSLKLAVSGWMLDRANPLTAASPAALARARALLSTLGGSPYVAAVENEHFDLSRPGLLHFNVVLVTGTQEPL